jgi:hypothetical protein
MSVDDEPRHLVGLIGHDLIVEEGRKRQVGKRELGGDTLLAGLRRDAGELVAAAQRRGLGHERLEIGKRVAAVSDGRAVHRALELGCRPRSYQKCAHGWPRRVSA